ncbi:hypothetical protein C8J56DRAFT_821993 [Mycena floridula]|nr:hypothetical protein C8J56DRAFT_821993 [Mycena floridula]
MSTTVTQTQTQTRRLRSLSLRVINNFPPLFTLPAELILDILELSLVSSKPSVLACICRTVKTFIEAIIYRTVVLSAPKTVTLFHRTAEAKSASFLASHVKKLVVTSNVVPHSQQARQIWEILTACRGLKTLALPAGFHPITLASILSAPCHEALSELTIQACDELDQAGRVTSLHYPTKFILSPSASYLTHLRICEPSQGWCSPASILDAFGPLPNLTHLQLARRINANEENDALFMEDVTQILQSFGLKVLIISIYAPAWAPSQSVEDSSIWKLIQEAAQDEPRLMVAKGEYDAWQKEWIEPTRPINFWETTAGTLAAD